MLGDFLSLFQSESRRMWYTISLPTVYGENHHCHTKYSGGIPIALDKKIKRSCQSPARIQGTRAFWLQGLIWTCEAFYGWYVICQSGDCSSWWQVECPKGSKFIQSLCWDSAVGLRPMQEGKSLHVRQCGRKWWRASCPAMQTLLCFWQHSCKPQAARPPADCTPL